MFIPVIFFPCYVFYSHVFSLLPFRSCFICYFFSLDSLFPVPQSIQEEVKQQLDMLVDAGIIERSISEWACPMLMVKKKASSLMKNLNSE